MIDSTLYDCLSDIYYTSRCWWLQYRSKVSYHRLARRVSLRLIRPELNFRNEHYSSAGIEYIDRCLPAINRFVVEAVTSKILRPHHILWDNYYSLRIKKNPCSKRVSGIPE